MILDPWIIDDLLRREKKTEERPTLEISIPCQVDDEHDRIEDDVVPSFEVDFEVVL